MKSDRFEVTVRGDLSTVAYACREIGEVFGKYSNVMLKRRFAYNLKSDEMTMRFFVRILDTDEDTAEEYK